MAWDYFKPGARVAHTRVVELLTPATSQRDTVYRVRLNCCARHVEMSHYELMRAFRRNSLMCRVCWKGDMFSNVPMYKRHRTDTRPYFPGWGFALVGPFGPRAGF